MNPALEAEFHEEMISIYYKAGHETGYWANRFLQKVRKDGGLQAARQWRSDREKTFLWAFNVWRRKRGQICPWRL